MKVDSHQTFQDEEEAFRLIIEAIEKAGYEPGKDVCLALDLASTEMYDEAKKIGKDGYLLLENRRIQNKGANGRLYCRFSK